MHNKNNLEDLVVLLNLFDNSHQIERNFKTVMDFLREKNIVKFFILFGSSQECFSVFSRAEGKKYLQDMGNEAPLEFGSVFNAAFLQEKENYNRYALIFPEDDLGGKLEYGRRFLTTLESAIIPFILFFERLGEGFIDLQFLNKYFFDAESIFELKQTTNPLKPTVSITRGNFFPIFERAILDKYIYPRILGGQVQELEKVRKCRNCGKFFIGKRLSATFCSDKCRGAFHHAANTY